MFRVRGSARAVGRRSDGERDRTGSTLLLLDTTPEEIRTTESFPVTVITDLRRDGNRVNVNVNVNVKMYTTGQGSFGASSFGDESVNASGMQRGDTVWAVVAAPWVEVRLRP